MFLVYFKNMITIHINLFLSFVLTHNDVYFILPGKIEYARLSDQTIHQFTHHIYCVHALHESGFALLRVCIWIVAHFCGFAFELSRILPARRFCNIGFLRFFAPHCWFRIWTLRASNDSACAARVRMSTLPNWILQPGILRIWTLRAYYGPADSACSHCGPNPASNSPADSALSSCQTSPN